MQKQSASCLCGSVKFSIQLAELKLGACHCNTCRKWSAGPLMTISYIGDIEFKNSNIVKLYDSSQWAERAFCGDCGSHLFYHLKGTAQYHIAAWIFDNLPDLIFDHQVYIDKKPNCYSFSNHTHDLTETDILNMITQGVTDN